MNRSRLTAGAAAAGLLLLLVAAAALVRDDLRARQDAARQARSAADLGRQLQAARARADDLGSRLTALQAQDDQVRAELRNPTLTMWNSCGGPCAVGPGTVRVGAVPDTFELQVALTANVPLRVYVLTFHQWTQFDSCGFSVRCVGGGYQTFGPATSVDVTFTDAEGCSGYVWVLQTDGAGTVTPDVRVRYAPASQPTGVCAANP